MTDDMKEVLSITLGQILKFSEMENLEIQIVKKSKEILKNYEGKQYADLALDMTAYMLAFLACYKKYEAQLDATIKE